MRKLTIKNIGAIKHVDLELNRINVFIGPQSSGKSTISKILCYCMWVEKHCSYDFDSKKEEVESDFYANLIKFHRLDGYFNSSSYIEYEGVNIKFTYIHHIKQVYIHRRVTTFYKYPKISYIPAERNFIASILNYDKYNGENDVLSNFGYDWNEARTSIVEQDMSHVLDRDIAYRYKNGSDYISDGGVELQLRFASSGVLSFTPLYITLKYLLFNIYEDKKSLSFNQRTWVKDEITKGMDILDQIKIDHNEMCNTSSLDRHKEIIKSLIDLSKNSYFDTLPALADTKFSNEFISKSVSLLSIGFKNINQYFDYKYTQLFIEEPEQNLSPITQLRLINELFVLLNNSDRENNLILTTHSPYVLFTINNCIMRSIVKDNIPEDLRSELVGDKAAIDPKEISIYQIEDGRIHKIQDKDGNLNDNFINNAYKENSNEYFSLLNFYEDEE